MCARNARREKLAPNISTLFAEFFRLDYFFGNRSFCTDKFSNKNQTYVIYVYYVHRCVIYPYLIRCVPVQVLYSSARDFNMGRKFLSTVMLTCLATLAVLSISYGLNTTTTGTKKPPPCRDWYGITPPLPRKRDMRPDKLNRLLGSDFNPMWMSKMSIPQVSPVY